MKLLLDENLSPRLVARIADRYPASCHVRDLGLLGSEDRYIWTHAAAEGFVLVSKDTDFYQRSVMLGTPPKVIWLRVGNAGTGAIALLLRDAYGTVRRFADDPEAAFLVLSLE